MSSTTAARVAFPHATALTTVSILVISSVIASVSASAACKSSLDCSLNGDCLSGACVCDAAWSGSPTCDQMAFQSLDKQRMPGYYNASQSSWGGFPIKTEEGYSLVHAQMEHGCPLGSWTDNSIVGLSKSISGEVEGPYKFDKKLLPPFSHNPTIREFNGTFIIYFIGGWKTDAQNCTTGANEELAPGLPVRNCTGMLWPKSCGESMPGPMKDTCGPKDAPYLGNAGCGISIAHAKSLDGPWTVTPLVIENQWESEEIYCAHTNPSPVILPDGSVVIAFNAGFCHDSLETIGLARAPHWSGPYTLLAKEAVLRNPDGSPHHCEDPHLWKTKRGWHLLTHNQQGPQGVSSYGFAPFAANSAEMPSAWTLSPTTPYNCTIRYTDGTNGEATGCGNRPQIVFGPNNKPQWLINGAMAAKPDQGKGTWTLFRKIAADSTGAEALQF